MQINIKRILFFILLFICLLAALPVCAGQSDDAYDLFGDVVRVGLKYGSSAEKSYEISADSGFFVASVENGRVEVTLPITAYTAVTLSCENGVVVLSGDDGNMLLQDFGSSILLPADYDNDGTISVNGKAYRGGFEVSKNSYGTINLINVINTEHYVYGVLNSEMHHDYPIEALKAQAVAARSFAKLNIGRHDEYGFDICTGTHCQVYKGYSDEYAETNRAVDETAGICMYYNGEPVSAYYFKNSGGYTQNIKDVWGSSLGYLKAVEDPYSPEYSWSVSYTFEELEDKLSAAGNDIGSIISIEIVSRNVSGAVDTLRFTGNKGTVELTKEKIRTFFGSSTVKSTMFSFENSTVSSSNDKSESTGASTHVSVDMGKLVTVGKNGVVIELVSKNVTVIAAGEKSSNVEIESARITNGKQSIAASSYFDKSTDKNSHADVCESVSSSPVTLVGKGYGHGVGMPQDSAIEMAKQGFAFDEILQYYYTGIELI